MKITYNTTMLDVRKHNKQFIEHIKSMGFKAKHCALEEKSPHFVIYKFSWFLMDYTFYIDILPYGYEKNKALFNINENTNNYRGIIDEIAHMYYGCFGTDDIEVRVI